MNTNPFISIVIANYNFGHLLPATIESILHQDCDDYEIIVVDGGSTDNSVDVIKQYANHISWWVSEPDSGQSNAFNKGFAHAKGRFFTWLNADDILLPGTIKAVKSTLVSHPEAAWATGNLVRFLHKDGKIIEAPWGPHILPNWLQGKGRVVVFYGPTTFWSREAYQAIGLINEELHLAMDVDYWSRLNDAGYRQVRVNHACWGFRMHEDSKTAEFGEHEKSNKNKLLMQREKEYLMRNHSTPKKIWRYMGLLMRLLDGSILKALVNRKALIGKSIKEKYGIEYDLLFNIK